MSADTKVSIVMPVFNVAANPRLREYLAVAMESILLQDFASWELIAVNDGSSDDTGRLLDAWAKRDCRIHVCHLEKNGGIANAINQGVAASRGKLIARMDADDISVPYRLSLQADFLGQHPEVGIVGSHMYVISEHSQVIMQVSRPQLHEDILRFCVELGCPFVHGSVMMRRSLFQQVGGYSTDHEWDYCEDFEMWYRVLSAARGHNLQEPLYCYRQHSSSISQTKAEKQAIATEKVIRMFRNRLEANLIATKSAA